MMQSRVSQQGVSNTVPLVYLTCETILFFVSVILNSIVIIDIYRKRDYITPSRVFNLHLAIADILNGLDGLPITIFEFLKSDEIDFSTCLAMNTTVMSMENISIVMLFCVVGERFIAIRFPFHYYHIDCQSASYFLLAVWAVCLSLGIIPLFWNQGSDNYQECYLTAVIPYDYMFYVNFLLVTGIPIVSMSCMYIYISIVIRRHEMKESTMSSRFKTTPKVSKSRKCNRPAILILIILVLLLPRHVVNTLNYFELTTNWSHKTKLHLFWGAITLSNFNAVLNPIIYSRRPLSNLKALSHPILSIRRPKPTSVCLSRLTSFAMTDRTPTSEKNIKDNKHDFIEEDLDYGLNLVVCEEENIKIASTHNHSKITRIGSRKTPTPEALHPQT